MKLYKRINDCLNKNFGKDISSLFLFSSVVAFSPMFLVMTVGAKSFEIFRRIIFSITVFVVNGQIFDVFLRASCTTNVTELQDRHGKPMCDVRYFRMFGVITNRSTQSTAIFFSALKSHPTFNYFPARFTWMSLDAR